MGFEIVLQVRSMDICRFFYRDVLEFGEPEVDSVELVRFNPDNNTALVLELCAAPYLEHASSATQWGLVTEKFDHLCRKLLKHDETPGEEFCHLGRRARRFSDPEGNVFILIEAARPER